MFNPLPAIALLPLALIWFGLGYGSIVFVIVHSVLWAVALNTHSGFLSVSNTLRMVGRNYGLSGLRYVGGDPDPGGVPEHPHRTQDRLGVRVAYADRRGARFRRVVGIGRPRLVHLREQESTRDSGGVRRAVHRDPDRARRRERRYSGRSKSAPFAAGGCKADDHCTFAKRELSALSPRVSRSPTSGRRGLSTASSSAAPKAARRTSGSISTSTATRSSRTRSARAGWPTRRAWSTARTSRSGISASILELPAWEALAAKLKAAGTKFIVEPYVRFKGLPGEQATMFFLDPFGNALEFKAFGDIDLAVRQNRSLVRCASSSANSWTPPRSRALAAHARHAATTERSSIGPMRCRGSARGRRRARRAQPDAGAIATARRARRRSRSSAGSASGLDNIDVRRLSRARGIEVIPATGANALAVAEYVIGSARCCCCAARIRRPRRSAAGQWPRAALVNGRELAGKTLGRRRLRRHRPPCGTARAARSACAPIGLRPADRRRPRRSGTTAGDGRVRPRRVARRGRRRHAARAAGRRDAAPDRRARASRG